MAKHPQALPQPPRPSPAQRLAVLAAALALTLFTALLIPLCDLLAPRPRKLVEYRTIELSDWRPKPPPPTLPPPPKPLPQPPPPPPPTRTSLPRPQPLAPTPQPAEPLRLPVRLDFALGAIRSDLALDFTADPTARALPGIASSPDAQAPAAPPPAPAPGAAVVADASEPLDRPPAVLSQSKPIYPYRARTRRVEGRVDLQFTVTPHGSVDSITVVSAEPVGVFDDAAVQAVRSWRFSPGVRAGEPVPTRMQIRIRFDLTE